MNQFQAAHPFNSSTLRFESPLGLERSGPGSPSLGFGRSRSGAPILPPGGWISPACIRTQILNPFFLKKFSFLRWCSVTGTSPPSTFCHRPLARKFPSARAHRWIKIMPPQTGAPGAGKPRAAERVVSGNRKLLWFVQSLRGRTGVVCRTPQRLNKILGMWLPVAREPCPATGGDAGCFPRRWFAKRKDGP